jgi:hypothetical protein
MYGRPEVADGFFRAFPRGTPIPWTKLQRECGAVIDALQIGFFFQREGDTMYMPSGWPHAVYNIEYSVSANFCLLRPSSLRATADSVADFGFDRGIDTHVLFSLTLLRHDELNLSEAEARVHWDYYLSKLSADAKAKALAKHAELAAAQMEIEHESE